MIFNILGFNASWFGLILYGNAFIVFTVAWLATHLYYCHAKNKLKYELQLIFSISILGIAVDSLLFQLGIFVSSNGFMPLWLMILWASFAATIAHSLLFLSRSKIMQIIVGSIFPPLSYIAGANLGEVSLGQSQWLSFFILSPIWAALFIVFYTLQKHFYSPPCSPIYSTCYVKRK